MITISTYYIASNVCKIPVRRPRHPNQPRIYWKRSGYKNGRYGDCLNYGRMCLDIVLRRPDDCLLSSFLFLRY